MQRPRRTRDRPSRTESPNQVLQSGDRAGVGARAVALIDVEQGDRTHGVLAGRERAGNAARVVARTLGARARKARASELVADTPPRGLHWILPPYAAKQPKRGQQQYPGHAPEQH